MPLVSLFILFQLPIYLNYKFPDAYYHAIYLCVFINLIVIPLSLSFYLKKQGMIQSIQMNAVEERVYPFGITILFYGITYFLFSQMHLPAFYLTVLLAAALSLIVLFIFSLLKYKISAHMTGIGGTCGMLFMVNQFYQTDTVILFSISLFLASIVASARLYLNKHSLSEITFGFLNGFLCQLSLLL